MAIDLQALLASFPEVVFEKGETIYHYYDKVDCLYYLIEGSTARMTLMPSGERIIFEERTPTGGVSDMLGVLAAYTEHGWVVHEIMALSRCRCRRVPAEDFFALARSHPEILEALLRLSMVQYKELGDNFLAKQRGMAAPRVADFILSHAEIDQQGRLMLDKHFTNAELARFVGMHRMTVNKIVLALERKGCLQRCSEGLQIADREELSAYARGEEKLHYKQ